MFTFSCFVFYVLGNSCFVGQSHNSVVVYYTARLQRDYVNIDAEDVDIRKVDNNNNNNLRLQAKPYTNNDGQRFILYYHE